MKVFFLFIDIYFVCLYTLQKKAQANSVNLKKCIMRQTKQSNEFKNGRKMSILKRASNIAVTFYKLLSNKENYQSYYPSVQHKGKDRVLSDLIWWFFNKKETNLFYYLYGFDAKTNTTKDQALYMPYKRFMRIRAEGNKNGSPTSQILLLRNKLFFFKYMKMNGFSVPEVFAAKINGKLIDMSFKPIEVGRIKNETDYFAKSIDGECADFVKHIKDYSELNVYMSSIDNRDFILQERVVQHSRLSHLNPFSVNTIRMVTIMGEEGPKLFHALLRIGTKQSGDCDNTSQGGIAVGIDQEGFLMEYGFRKPKYGGRMKEHPDTGVVFEGFQVPFYKEAISAALAAHSTMYGIKTIGWDIAITENGPVFIEGNDNWELQSFQAIFGGLENELDQLM